MGEELVPDRRTRTDDWRIGITAQIGGAWVGGGILCGGAIRSERLNQQAGILFTGIGVGVGCFNSVSIVSFDSLSDFSTIQPFSLSDLDNAVGRIDTGGISLANLGCSYLLASAYAPSHGPLFEAALEYSCGITSPAARTLSISGGAISVTGVWTVDNGVRVSSDRGPIHRTIKSMNRYIFID